jgi:peptide chain release factor subunit 1
MISSTVEGHRLPESAIAEANRLLGTETIDRIRRFHADGLPVVSIYLAIPPGRRARATAQTKADSLMHRIRPHGEERSLGHRARLSFRGDLELIGEVLENGTLAAGTLAIFSCSAGGLFEVVSLPRAVRDRIMLDATPWVRPLLAMLAEHHRCFAVVLDSDSAHAWELYLGRVRDAGPLSGAQTHWVDSQPINERRAASKAREFERRHFRLLAAALEDLLSADRGEILALGGHESELPRFVALLSDPVRERVAGTFAANHDAIGKATVREQGQAILDRYELDLERRLVAEVFDHAAAGGLAAIGLPDCLWAGSTAAVKALYVQEGVTVPGVVCDRSRWFGLAGERCPLCGRPTRETPDVIDELVETVIDEGGAIHHVRAETKLKQLLVAASLRFALAPPPNLA